ncbi:MAG: bifunctional lysine ketoglutarate reductase /saccharopine dehydrogenase family protein [Thermotogota bacterium]
MRHKIGIRREDMYVWERRTPLIPEHVRELCDRHPLDVTIQSSGRRIFEDDDYRAVGLPVADRLTDCSVIIGLKEIPVDVIERDKVYVFFSHTIKGQPHNMSMLKRILDLGATIIDYERIVDGSGRRLVFFGNYAGLAGMIDTLWALGQRLLWEGIHTPLERVRQASSYASLAEAKAAIAAVGDEIRTRGLPKSISPLVIGVTGYGNVSRGAQEILGLLPLTEVSPSALLSGMPAVDPAHPIVKVLFKEQDTVAPQVAGKSFDLQEYYQHPERYRGTFAQYLPHLHTIVNCIYWEPKYPRLVTRQDVRDQFESQRPKLRVIGDISCDVKGAIEVTVRATEPDDPIYVYDISRGTTTPGVGGKGPVIMAVEILPSELPREASAYFSNILKAFVPQIAAADYSKSLDACGLSPELKRAVIACRGNLTPDYRYLEQHLNSA